MRWIGYFQSAQQLKRNGDKSSMEKSKRRNTGQGLEKDNKHTKQRRKMTGIYFQKCWAWPDTAPFEVCGKTFIDFKRNIDWLMFSALKHSILSLSELDPKDKDLAAIMVSIAILTIRCLTPKTDTGRSCTALSNAPHCIVPHLLHFRNWPFRIRARLPSFSLVLEAF